jgi:hypothetical protein
MEHSANFSHAAIGPPARMKHSRRPRMGSLRESFYTHRVCKMNLKFDNLTNEIMKLNHEKIENGKLTKTPQTARRMMARSSRKLTMKVEGKMEVFCTQMVKGESDMVK